MLIENFVYLARINILTTTNDHVGFAIDDEEVTILVAIADVSRMKPTIAKGGCSSFWILVIALQNILAAQNDFTELAVSDFFVVVVKDFHFISDRQTTRTRASALVGRIKGRAASRLREAVTFDYRAVEGLFKLLHHLGGHRRRSAHLKAKLIARPPFRNSLRIITQEH